MVLDMLLDNHLLFLEDAPVLTKPSKAWSMLPGARCLLEPCSVGEMTPGVEDNPLYQFLVVLFALGYPGVVTKARLLRVAKGILHLTFQIGFAGSPRGVRDVVMTTTTTFLPPPPPLPRSTHAHILLWSPRHSPPWHRFAEGDVSQKRKRHTRDPATSCPDVGEAATTT